ncbi:MAG: hypothetical protein K6F87_08515 [Lachnospiraceae bacterium]|nr:hypothetical protein [Lachnospiraceae bacterium]
MMFWRIKDEDHLKTGGKTSAEEVMLIRNEANLADFKRQFSITDEIEKIY